MGFDQVTGQSQMIRAYYKQLPRSYLYYGYTTVVDLAVTDRKVLQDLRQAPLRPDLYSCGEPVVFANGYPMSFVPPELRFELFSNFIYDPEQASSIPSEYKPEGHTPAADVARVKGEGGICVKTFFERGFGRFRIAGVEAVFWRRCASATRGLVLCAANSLGRVRVMGVDVIAHGSGIGRSQETSCR